MGHDWVQDINDMHAKFGVHEAVAKMDAEKLQKFLGFRFDFLTEELNEGENNFYGDIDEIEFDGLTDEEIELKRADEVVDACIDLCVVAIGTLDAFGVDAYTAWDRVLAANMAKEPGIKPERPNPLGLPDLIKPKNWVAPSHKDNVGLIPQTLH